MTIPPMNQGMIRTYTKRGAPSCPICAAYGVETRVRAGLRCIEVRSGGAVPYVGAPCPDCRRAEKNLPDDMEPSPVLDRVWSRREAD